MPYDESSSDASRSRRGRHDDDPWARARDGYAQGGDRSRRYDARLHQERDNRPRDRRQDERDRNPQWQHAHEPQQHPSHHQGRGHHQDAQQRGPERAQERRDHRRDRSQDVATPEDIQLLHTSVLISLLRDRRERDRAEQAILHIPITMSDCRTALISCTRKWVDDRPARGVHPAGPLHTLQLRALLDHQPSNQPLATMSAFKALDTAVKAGLQPITGIKPIGSLLSDNVGKTSIRLIVRFNPLTAHDAFKHIMSSICEPDESCWTWGHDTAPLDRNARALLDAARSG